MIAKAIYAALFSWLVYYLYSREHDISGIMDTDHLLSAEETQKILEVSEEIRKGFGFYVAIQINNPKYSSLENEETSKYHAIKLFKDWKSYWKTSSKHGILIYIQNKHIEIVTGSKVQKILTNDLIHHLIHDEVLPHFKSAQIGEAILYTVTSCLNKLRTKETTWTRWSDSFTFIGFVIFCGYLWMTFKYEENEQQNNNNGIIIKDGENVANVQSQPKRDSDSDSDDDDDRDDSPGGSGGSFSS